MKQLDYTAPKPSYLMRLLWSAAGGDEMLLRNSTYSDQVKYMCLGGIIVSTGLMAGIAGGYAFYTIFEPKGDAIESVGTHMPTMISSMFFGLIWGAIIFNIDRFIVSSTGKGDGTEAITWTEFTGAIPRIIMGIIISITISKPVEIRMFKSEIDVRLQEEQDILASKNETHQRNLFEIDVLPLNKEKEKIEGERKKLQYSIKEYDDKYQNEVAGSQGGRVKGEGPVALTFLRERQRAENKLASFDSDNRSKLDEINEKILKKENKRDVKINDREKVASGLDGLLERIKLAHVLAGTWISLFITLLFMAIELTPIFFKLMLIKSPYDYIEENIKELAKAKAGIHITYDYYTDGDKQGIERHLVRNLNAEKIINDKVNLLDSQKRLTEYAIQKFEEKIKKQIDENPEDYISFGSENSNNEA
jgi:hypothetical protein